jgi:hypothetical protein
MGLRGIVLAEIYEHYAGKEGRATDRLRNYGTDGTGIAAA